MGQPGGEWWYSNSGQADGQDWEPAQHGHPPTEAATAAPEGYGQSEHLRRVYGAQAGAPGRELRDTEARFSPQAPAYGQPGQRYASPPRKSWPAAHKGLTATVSLCALAVTVAAAFALAPSRPGTASAAAAATAGGPAAGASAAGPAPGGQAGGQPGTTATPGAPAGVTVTGTGKAARAAGGAAPAPTASAAVPGAPAVAAPGAGTGASPAAAAGGGGVPVVAASTPVVTVSTPVVIITAPHTALAGPPTPSLTPSPQATCSVTAHVPVVQAVVTGTTARTAAVSVSVREYDAAGMLLETIVISVPAPAAGGTVTGGGPANPSLVSCQAGAVSETGN